MITETAEKMSRKDRKGGGTVGPHREGTRGAVEWLLERRQFRDALKQAKLCFRAAELAEDRILLERTYVLRVRDLADQTLSQAAAEVARSALEFGISSDSLLVELVGVLPRIGMATEAAACANRLQAPEIQAELSARTIDWAVRNLDKAEVPAELRDGAARIRGALTALADGRETEAFELLQGFARQSPWADWRYFVRGLAAHYRGEAAAATANWDRLAPNRLAAKIAATLQEGSSPQPPSPAALTRLERAAFGEPVSERFQRLRQLLLDAGDEPSAAWKQALGVIESLRRVLTSVDVGWAQRLTNVLTEPLCEAAHKLPYETAQRLIGGFQKATEPLPWDPGWHRFMALAWEPQCLITAVGHWRLFLEAIPRISVWTSRDRQRLEALVWRHIASLLDQSLDQEMANCCAFDYEDLRPEERPKIDALRREVVEALETSLRLDPLQRATYAEAMTIYSHWQDEPAQARIAERQLEAFPDDVKALEFLIEYHLEHDESQTALDYLKRARQLRPLDKRLTTHAYRAHTTLARQLALEGRFDEGRASLDACDALVPEAAGNYRMCARRAALEYKAKQPSRAAEFVEAGLAKAAAPVSFYHCMSVESHCYKLPKTRQAEFESHWKKGLGVKKSGPAASEMAKTMIAVLWQKTNYPGRDAHVAKVVAYLQRTSRTKYTEDELRDVCEFLDLAEVGTRWFEMLTRRGQREFPRNPLFFRFRGRILLRDERNPGSLFQAEYQFQSALQLAQEDARYGYLLEAIKTDLAEMDDRKREIQAFGRFPQMLDFDDDEDADNEDAGDEDGGDERAFSGGRQPDRSILQIIQDVVRNGEPGSLPPPLRKLIDQLREQERADR